jgi:hypothetical protein
MTLPARPGLQIRRVGPEKLASHEEPEGLLGRIHSAAYLLWPTPLAVWWLG